MSTEFFVIPPGKLEYDVVFLAFEESPDFDLNQIQEVPLSKCASVRHRESGDRMYLGRYPGESRDDTPGGETISDMFVARFGGNEIGHHLKFLHERFGVTFASYLGVVWPPRNDEETTYFQAMTGAWPDVG
jgi:hypothetical protein